MITSSNNTQIKNIILLQKKQKARHDQKVFVIEGIKMYEEAKNLGLLNKTYVSEHFYNQLIQTDPTYLEGIEYEVVNDKVFLDMSDTITPQGILALVKMPSYSVTDMLDREDASLLLLEDVRDPGNLGTIMRTAEAAGITGVIISKESVDLFNPKVIRSTMGSIYRLPFVYVEQFIDTLHLLKKNNFKLFATHLSGKKQYDEADYKGKCGIIIGNEAHGISEEAANTANELVIIPMCGNVESLNAAIAAAVMMYETFRQKRNQ